ncbi:MAG: hypothetical protein WDO72_19870 [Pseudomonadota bacterium]
MNTNRFWSFLLTIAIAACSAAQARDDNTLQDEFRIYTADIATQCASVQEQLKTFIVESDPLTGYTLKDAVQSLCVCIPAKLEALKARTPAKDLERPVSEEDVLKLFNADVIDKCAAEQMQAMYGEDCPKRFKLADLDVPHYCSCMKGVMSAYSDTETAAIAAAAQDYLPTAAEAEKNGYPIPPRPPVLEAYFLADQGCKGMRKSFEQLKP